jgi:glycerophosphoryl diester phosphodiesterase
MRFANIIKLSIPALLIALSFTNASWIAPDPDSTLTLIAAHPADGKNCPTIETVRRALIDGGGLVALDAETAPGCMTLGAALQEFPRYHFQVQMRDGAKTLAIFDQLKLPLDERYSFTGDAASVAAIRARAPNAWAWTIAEGKQCFEDYVTKGWFSIVPDSCKGRTIIVPLEQRWKMAGWPNRFQARMKAAGTHVILTGPSGAPGTITGLTALAQVVDVPRSYKDYLLVEDATMIGPPIRQ